MCTVEFCSIVLFNSFVHIPLLADGGTTPIFHQTSGVTTGLICATQLANCFLLSLDIETARILGSDLCFYRRYVDDILVVFKAGSFSLINTILNGFDSNIKLFVMTMTLFVEPPSSTLMFPSLFQAFVFKPLENSQHLCLPSVQQLPSQGYEASYLHY